MYNKIWSRKELSPQKLGTFGEYYAKMALASYGLDIFTSEVDDHGIDFVAESADGGFMKFQVKSLRKLNYLYIREEIFSPSMGNLYLILVLLNDNEEPKLYVIPISAWSEPENTMFVYHAYEGKKSAPEYGINFSQKNMPQLERYSLVNMIDKLR